MTTTLTVNGLYAADANVRAMIDTWVEHRRCPAPLGDYLEETYDLLAAADCARWAATQEDLPVLQPHIPGGERGGSCGPYPTQNNGHGKNEWYWFWDSKFFKNARDHAHHIPDRATSEEYPGSAHHSEVLDALLWLLDNWIMGCKS
jgi:hypothetical protein